LCVFVINDDRADTLSFAPRLNFKQPLYKLHGYVEFEKNRNPFSSVLWHCVLPPDMLLAIGNWHLPCTVHGAAVNADTKCRALRCYLDSELQRCPTLCGGLVASAITVGSDGKGIFWRELYTWDKIEYFLLASLTLRTLRVRDSPSFSWKFHYTPVNMERVA